MRLRTVAALAAGYVLGTRAGRDRYDQIVEAARHSAARLQGGEYELPTLDSLRSSLRLPGRDEEPDDDRPGRGR